LLLQVDMLSELQYKTPTYTVIVWAGSVFLRYLPPRQSCYLGQRGYVFIVYSNSAWMSSGEALEITYN